MESIKNLDSFNERYRQSLDTYMNKLIKLHGENIVSIFLYADAAEDGFLPGSSDINSAVVFKDLGFLQLKMSLDLVNKGIRKGIAAPLFLTREHIKSSLDTFPIEFLEMKEKHLLIYGDDLLSELAIETSHIRFICEEQLKGKLIRIRQAYLEIGLRKKGMEALIKESLNSIFPILRSLLRLKGIAPPVKKEEVIESLSETFGVNGDLFLAVLRDTKNDEKIQGESLESFLEKYIIEIEKLALLADGL